MYFSIRSVFTTNPEAFADAVGYKIVLFKALISGSDEEFNKALHDFNVAYNLANKQSTNSLSDKKYILLYTWLQIIPILLMHEIDESDFNSHHLKFYYELEKLETLDDITDLNTQFFISCKNYYNNRFVNTEYTSFTKDCMTFINENIYNKFILDDLADKLHYNSYYLSKKFKKETGMSIAQYVLQAKINEARTLLEKKYSIKAISDKLSFSSQSYFTECFKKSIGITPKQYQYLIKK